QSIFAQHSQKVLELLKTQPAQNSRDLHNALDVYEGFSFEEKVSLFAYLDDSTQVEKASYLANSYVFYVMNDGKSAERNKFEKILVNVLSNSKSEYVIGFTLQLMR